MGNSSIRKIFTIENSKENLEILSSKKNEMYKNTDERQYLRVKLVSKPWVTQRGGKTRDLDIDSTSKIQGKLLNSDHLAVVMLLEPEYRSDYIKSI